MVTTVLTIGQMTPRVRSAKQGRAAKPAIVAARPCLALRTRGLFGQGGESGHQYAKNASGIRSSGN